MKCDALLFAELYFQYVNGVDNQTACGHYHDDQQKYQQSDDQPHAEKHDDRLGCTQLNSIDDHDRRMDR